LKKEKVTGNQYMEVVIPLKDRKELIAVELQGKVEIISNDFSLKDLTLGTLTISVSIFIYLIFLE
jgi:hypothetical protein